MSARTRAICTLAILLSSGCAPELEPQNEVRALRVLGVKKDKPYGAPGDTVRLSMLLADGSDEAPRPLQILWLAGCENPEGDLYFRCFEDAGDGLDASEIQVGEGLEFSFDITPTIISRRPLPSDPDQPPYGLAYVFFAVCAGEVGLAEPDGETALPFGCFSESGERRGPRDFIAGYTGIFVYDHFTNENPRITGFTVDGQPVVPECIDDDCIPLLAREIGLSENAVGIVDAGAADAGAADAGAADAETAGAEVPDAAIEGGAGEAGRADAGTSPCDPVGPACVNACPQSGDCDSRSVQVLVDPDSIERDTVGEARGNESLLEQMWVNYYVDRGSLGADVKLINDATRGFNPEYGTSFEAPKERGQLRLWAVVRDSRGGTSWVRVRLQAR